VQSLLGVDANSLAYVVIMLAGCYGCSDLQYKRAFAMTGHLCRVLWLQVATCSRLQDARAFVMAVDVLMIVLIALQSQEVRQIAAECKLP
jgi:hypothetical protein